jgi:outer membrane protein assembly factor BamB
MNLTIKTRQEDYRVACSPLLKREGLGVGYRIREAQGKIQNSSVIILLLCLLIILSTENFFCRSMKTSAAPAKNADDWQFYGGDIGRANIAKSAVAPPLKLAWQSDGSAGFGQFSACAEDSFLFVSNLAGEMHMLNVTNGDELGSCAFGSSILASPVIDGENVYAALSHDKNNLDGYSLLTNGVVWRLKTASIETSPLLIGDDLYLTTLAGELLCVERNHGMLQWTFTGGPKLPQSQIHSSPSSDGNRFVFGRDDGRIICTDTSGKNLLWSFKTKESVLATPTVADSAVYVGSLDSIFYALRVADGSLIWKQSLSSRIYASQAVWQNSVFVGTALGVVYCLDRLTGEIRWKYQTAGDISCAPVVSGNVVYAASLDKTLYAFDARTGAVLWRFKGEGRIKTSPIIHRGYLILLQDDRSITAFKSMGGQTP